MRPLLIKAFNSFHTHVIISVPSTMAILRDVPGLVVQLTVRGIPLREYSTAAHNQAHMQNGRKRTKIIQSVTGEAFDLRITFGPDFEVPGDLGQTGRVGIFVFRDGERRADSRSLVRLKWILQKIDRGDDYPKTMPTIRRRKHNTWELFNREFLVLESGGLILYLLVRENP